MSTPDLVQHTTAVVITPPKELWQPIQAIREKNDRTFKEWMPHVTLDYPSIRRTDFKEFSIFLNDFLYEDPETKTKPKIRKFDLYLDSVSLFGAKPGTYTPGKVLLFAYPREEGEEKKALITPPPPTPKGTPRPAGVRGRGGRRGRGRPMMGRGGRLAPGGAEPEVFNEPNEGTLDKQTNLKNLQALIQQAHNLFIQKLEAQKAKKAEEAAKASGELAPASAPTSASEPVSANVEAPALNTFSPHLTLGQFGFEKRYRTIKKYYELFEKEICPTMNNLKFTVDKISFVRRIDMKSPMEEVYEIKLPE